VKVAVIPQSQRLSSDGLLDRDLRTPTVEAMLAMRGGLPHDAAEAALTINAARILGVDDRVGSLEPGKDADLIILDGDLLAYESFVYYAVVNGRLVYDKAKEPLFRDLRPRLFLRRHRAGDFGRGSGRSDRRNMLLTGSPCG
jgi:adenine deaminase